MANVSALTVHPGDVVVADFPGVQETNTLPRQDILAVIGHISDQDWRQIKARLALAMPS